MAAMTHPVIRRALSFGSGIGLELGQRDLHVVIVRARPTGPAMAGEIVIQDFRERPAAEWGGELQRFLAEHEAAHSVAVALLPREEIVLRMVPLPGLSDEDTASAIRLQVDSLHPWGDEEDVAFDWQRIGDTALCAVALARRERVDYYTSLFAESGVKLAGLSFTASAVYRASRLFAGERSGARLAVTRLASHEGGMVEVYGESDAWPLLSAQFDLPVDRAIGLSAAEMRIEVPEEVPDILHLLPQTVGAPDSADLSDQARSYRAPAYAAALTAACLHLGEPLNLLPAELRRGVSKAVYIPTAVLGTILGVLLLGLVFEGSWLDRNHQERLQAEIKILEPAAKRLESIDRQTAAMAERIRLIDGFRKRPAADLDVVREINKLLPPPAFVQQLTIDEQSVFVAGEVDQAESLLKAFDSSPLFRETEFTMPLNRGQSGEMFRLKAKREAAQ
jgi:hypothetical protein